VISSSEEFERSTDSFRRELLAHCYQMLGSVQDAEDMVQETMLRAWRARDRFDSRRSTIRTWLYHIATNACLSALQSRRRRRLPSGFVAASDAPEEPLTRASDVTWLQPLPEAMLRTDPGDPANVLVSRGHLRLALVAAMQLLSARQRAAVILRDVLGFSAFEVAEMLGITPVAVNGALQRARARLIGVAEPVSSITEPRDPRNFLLVEQYAAAFESGDIPKIKQLLSADVILEMPPFVEWYAGPEDYCRLIARVYVEQGTDWHMVPTAANGAPALAAYVRETYGGYRAHTLQVFDVSTGRISRNTAFRDPAIFTLFGLSERLTV
jgi:RNA polymerase sigma-70 factor (ECF subfamily)